jgi:hypothetical protein
VALTEPTAGTLALSQTSAELATQEPNFRKQEMKFFEVPGGGSKVLEQ